MTAEEKKEKFNEIAFDCMDSLYSTALRMTRNAAEAEDLVQDTYLRAFRFFDKFEPGTNFKAWIFRILTNSYINRYRKKARSPQRVHFDKVEFALEDEEPSRPYQEWQGIDESDYKEMFDDDIYASLNRLSEEFRIVILLADVEDFSYKEIAEIIDRPIGTVMSRLFRGRRMLQKKLAGYAVKEGYIREYDYANMN